MSRQKNNLLIVMAGIIVAVIVATFIKANYFISQRIVPLVSSAPPIIQTTPTSSTTPITPETLHSASIVCGDAAYFFDSISVTSERDKDILVTNIYRARGPGPKEFITRLTPTQQESVYAGKKYATRWIFVPLSAPKKNCDQIYLTNLFFISHPIPVERIFRWSIGAQTAEELKISKEFAGNYIPYYSERGRVPPVSSDGEKILVVQREGSSPENNYCGFRLLRLLRLRKDAAETLVLLPQTESFDSGTSDLEPYCEGLHFGWQNDSTIYYDVYDATTQTNRPLKERRTLKIN